MSIISEHRPHVPWRKAAAVITRRRDGEGLHVELHVADAEPSIAQWLASGDVPAMPELAPSAPLLPLERRQVTVHRELDDDEALAVAMLAMERDAHSLADQLAEENDTRLALLLAASEAAVSRSAGRLRWIESRWEQSHAAEVFRRRRERVRELVPALGHLLAEGWVSQETAVAVMGLRSRYLSAAETDSSLLPKLTPSLLAVLDAERDARTAVAQ